MFSYHSIPFHSFVQTDRLSMLQLKQQQQQQEIIYIADEIRA